MRHYYNSSNDMSAIAREFAVEVNNPLIKDIVRLARLWHSDKSGARRTLSWEYDNRDNTGTLMVNINYNENGSYTIATIAIGRGCISSDIINTRIGFNYSSILNSASTKITIETIDSVAMTKVLNILSKSNYDDSFYLRENNLLEVNFKNVNLNQVMNIITSIKESFDSGQYKSLNNNW